MKIELDEGLHFVHFLPIDCSQVDVAYLFVVAVGVAGVASTLYYGVAERAGCDAVFPLLLADVALVESAVSDFDFILCCHICNVLRCDTQMSVLLPLTIGDGVVGAFLVNACPLGAYHLATLGFGVNNLHLVNAIPIGVSDTARLYLDTLQSVCLDFLAVDFCCEHIALCFYSLT